MADYSVQGHSKVGEDPDGPEEGQDATQVGRLVRPTPIVEAVVVLPEGGLQD